MKLGKLKYIDKIPTKYYWIISFVLGALCMYMMLSLCEVLSTGRYCILNGDSLYENVPVIKQFCNDILNGQSVYYSFANNFGTNTSLINSFFSAYNIFNILFIIFPKVDPNILIAAIVVINTGLASMCFYIFVTKAYSVKPATALMISVLYAMCGFNVSMNVVCFIWIEAMWLLPLIMLSIKRLISGDNRYLIILTVLYAYLFIAQFYMGYIIGFFSLGFFLLNLFLYEKDKRIILITILKYALSGVVAVMLSAFVWLPTLILLMNNSAEDSTRFTALPINILNVFSMLLWGQVKGFSNNLPYVYIGIIPFLTLPLYFIDRKIVLKEKLIWGILCGLLMLSCVIKPLFMFWHAFDAPDSWNYRFSFLISFCICVIACYILDGISDNIINGKRTIAAMSVYVLITFLNYLLSPDFGEYDVMYKLIIIGINALLIVIYFMMFLLFSKADVEGKQVIVLLCLLITVIDIVSSGIMQYKSYYGTSLEVRHEQYDKYIADVEEELAQIDDESFYRINNNDSFMKNEDSYFGYFGTSDFSSSESPKLRDALSRLGMFTSPRLLYNYGLTSFSKLILGVKYEIMEDRAESADVIAIGVEEHDNKVKVRDYYLNVGFMIAGEAKDYVLEDTNAFDNTNYIASVMTGEDVALFQELPFEDVTVVENGISLTKDEEGINISGEGDEASIEFAIDNPEDDVYIYFENENSLVNYNSYMIRDYNGIGEGSDAHTTVSYVRKMNNDGNKSFAIVESGYLSKSENFTNIRFAKCCEDELKTVYDNLSKEQLVVSEYKDGYILGNIHTDGNKQLLFTSIPYEKGWSLRVNGEEAKILPLINDAFIGIYLPEAGDYNVEITFKAPGAKEGIIISTVGVALVLMIISGQLLINKS